MDDGGTWKAEKPNSQSREKLLNMGHPDSGLLCNCNNLGADTSPGPTARVYTKEMAYDGCLSVLGTRYEAYRLRPRVSYPYACVGGQFNKPLAGTEKLRAQAEDMELPVGAKIPKLVPCYMNNATSGCGSPCYSPCSRSTRHCPVMREKRGQSQKPVPLVFKTLPGSLPVWALDHLIT